MLAAYRDDIATKVSECIRKPYVEPSRVVVEGVALTTVDPQFH